MAGIEIRIVSDQRNGLTTEPIDIITKYCYALMRQRITHDPQSIFLRLNLQGLDNSLTALEKSIALHPHMLSLESQRTSEPMRVVEAAEFQSPSTTDSLSQPVSRLEQNKADEEKVDSLDSIQWWAGSQPIWSGHLWCAPLMITVFSLSIVRRQHRAALTTHLQIKNRCSLQRRATPTNVGDYKKA